MFPMVNFKLDAFVTVINELVRADEVERALWVCDNLPAYYRDNEPEEIYHLREEIISRLMTPPRYSEEKSHLDEVVQNDNTNIDLSLRAILIKKDVELFNKAGLVPHITDLGPGNYFVPRLLHRDGLNFTYNPITIHKDAFYEGYMRCFKQYHKAEKVSDRPNIFIACEIIEHLWNPLEIKSNMLAYSHLPDIIHLSTPKYTFDFQNKDLKDRSKNLEHLRAYTPSEFLKIAKEMFGVTHDFLLYEDQIMQIRGRLKISKYDPVEQPDITKEFDAAIKRINQILQTGPQESKV